MLEQNRVAINGEPPPEAVIPFVQFYSIELSQLADGRVSVGIAATLCEDEGELSKMNIVSRRVDKLGRV